MREIKFRAWWKDNHSKVKDDVILGNFDDLYFSNINNEIFHDNENQTMIFEQFTGLHDKNGKEIYEGDILTNYGVTKEMKTRRYEVVFTEDRARFSAYDLSSKWNTSMSSYDMKQCEVIGNKYENPELIN